MFDFELSGDNPRLLVHCGTHGDEYSVIPLVSNAIKKYKKQLPSFLYVPQVSPSAVKHRTRKNVLGNDMNRVFYSDSADPEIKQNIELIKDKKFDMFVSFHEDPIESGYYLYDVGFGTEPNKLLLTHNEKLRKNGVELFSGIDDPTDPDLGYDIVDGYIKITHPEEYFDDGTISAWVLNRRVAKEYLLPEIPTKFSKEKKIFTINSFFEDVILTSF